MDPDMGIKQNGDITISSGHRLFLPPNPIYIGVHQRFNFCSQSRHDLFLFPSFPRRAFSAATVADVALCPLATDRPTDRPTDGLRLSACLPVSPLSHSAIAAAAFQLCPTNPTLTADDDYGGDGDDATSPLSVPRVFPTSCFPIVSWGSSPTDHRSRRLNGCGWKGGGEALRAREHQRISPLPNISPSHLHIHAIFYTLVLHLCRVILLVYLRVAESGDLSVMF